MGGTSKTTMEVAFLILLTLLVKMVPAKFASNNICLAMPNGSKLPVASDCSKYIVCRYNEQNIVQCPGGTLFDPVLNVCNWADSVPCTQTSTSAPIPSSTRPSWQTTSYTNAPTMTKPPITSGPIFPTQTTSPPTQTWPNWQTTPVVTTSQTNSPVPTQTWPGPTQHTTPIQTWPTPTTAPSFPTVPTTIHTQTWPTSTTPSQSSQTFPTFPTTTQITTQNIPTRTTTNTPSWSFPTMPEKPATQSTTMVTTTTRRPTTSVNPYPECNNDGFYFIPHPSSCESYYICAYGMLILHSCGDGVYWNTATHQCDFPGNTDCSNLPNPAAPETSTSAPASTSRTTTTTEGTTSTPLPNCNALEIFHACLWDCSKYYICIGTSPILMSCPTDYLWNADIAQCDRPDVAVCAK